MKIKLTRGSAIAEEPRDALRQLKLGLQDD